MEGDKTVKYGIIGVGMMGREHLINLHHLQPFGVQVVAIADPHVPSQQLALDLSATFGWPLKVLFLPSSSSLSLFCFLGIVFGALRIFSANHQRED